MGLEREVEGLRVMEREVGTWMVPFLFIFFLSMRWISANSEGDALHTFMTSLVDPNSILQSWDPTLDNPCNWFHVTCNNDNLVIRIDLGNANLSGSLVSELGTLNNLQYLELYSNNLSGPIPKDLGNLTSLVSLDLYMNSFTGGIPETLDRLQKLRFLRLNNNSLDGHIPMSLSGIRTLQLLDLSNNHLSGGVPDNGSFLLFTSVSFANNPGLCGPVTGKSCSGSPPFSTPPSFASVTSANSLGDFPFTPIPS